MLPSKQYPLALEHIAPMQSSDLCSAILNSRRRDAHEMYPNIHRHLSNTNDAFFRTFLMTFHARDPPPQLPLTPGAQNNNTKKSASPSYRNAYFQSKADQVIRNFEEASPSCKRIVRKRESVNPIE